MVDVLTGLEGGCWTVSTERSTYEFDLDAMTVTRVPGPAATQSPHDRKRIILEIIDCQVGRAGYWLMYPEGLEAEVFEYFWQYSTRILRIVPASVDREATSEPGEPG
jgi:hypothetical protein